MKLVPLDCPSCGSAMRGDSHDVLFLCDHCGGGAVLEAAELSPVDSTALLPSPGRRATTWRPAWVLDADVSVGRRFLANGRPSKGWSGERTFVIPAFGLPLNDLNRLARALSHASSQTGEVPHEPIVGGTMRLEDARTFARHLVVGDEVHQPDMLASVEVTVDITASRLAALPFEARNNLLSCAITGVSVRAEG